jgi:hypothetical protein
MYIVRQPLRCLSFLLSATSVSTSVYLVYVSGTLLSVKKQKECVGVCMAVCGCVCVCACGSVRACVPTTYPHNASCSSHLHCARRRRVTGHDQARSVMRHACRGSVPASSSSRWNHVKFDIGVQCLGVYTCSVTIYDFSWYITCLHSRLPYSQK